MEKYWNEEKVKNSVIIPFFKRLGFENAQFEYETHFKIMIPRKGSLEIGEKIAKNVYSDILCKYEINGELRNIFLIEVKRENHTITVEDIRQAISYSRLLEQIPPFSIITNGENTRIFDSITMGELFDGDKVDCHFDGLLPSIDSEIREEAVRMLAGLNSKNLIRICDLISEKNLLELKSTNDISKTVVESLHCIRDKYINEFKKYLKSEKVVYGVIGKSGYGKTNHVYSIWKKYHDQFPFLFINLGRLTSSLLDTLSEEFSFAISRDYTISEIVNQLTKLSSKDRLFIILDGIDEHPEFNRINNELNELVKHVIGTKIHLIMSCKITEFQGDQWKSITHYKGTLSNIGENLYSSQSAMKFGYIGTFIDKMDDIEIEQLWKKYKRKFNISGQLRGESKALSKEPYVLKMISEVFENKALNGEVTELDLYKKWVDLKISTLVNPQKGSYIFKRVVKYLVENNLTADDLDVIIDLTLNEIDGYSSLFELVKTGLLDVQTDMHGDKVISVCNESVKHYVYCFEIDKWYKLSVGGLINKFNTLIQSYYHRSILIYYISMMQNSFEEKKDIWSTCYSENDSYECIICKDYIKKNDDVTLVLEMNKEDFINERNLGEFKCVHKGCAYNGPSMFSLFPEDETAVLNFSDFLALEKIKRLFNNMTDNEIRTMSVSAEKSKAKRHKYYEYIPTLETRAEPFWAIMDFVDDVNTGQISGTKFNDTIIPLLFNSKEEAVQYLLKDIDSVYDGVFRKQIVGVNKTYFNEIDKLYKKVGHIPPKMAISLNGKDAVAYDFNILLDIVNSGLSHDDYLYAKSM